MRTRSQKANSGSPLQSLSTQAQQAKRTRSRVAKKDAPVKAKKPTAAVTNAVTNAVATTETNTTTTTTTTTAATRKTATSTAVMKTTNTAAAAPAAPETPTVKPKRTRTLRRRVTPPPTPRTHAPQLSGEELLQMIEKNRDEGRRKCNVSVLPDKRADDASSQEEQPQQATPQQAAPSPAKHATPQQATPRKSTAARAAPVTPAHQTSPAHQPAPDTPATVSAPANPTTPATQVASPQPATPRTTGWGIRSLFSSILPSVFTSPSRSPTIAAPAAGAQTAPTTAGPQSQQVTPAQSQIQQQNQIVLDQSQVDAIGVGLTPTPSRTSTRRNTRSRATTGRRGSSKGETTIINTALRDVSGNQKALAAAWAEKTAQKITADSTTLGSKRRQLEQPMKLKDVKDIPARRPWESAGSFGLLPEFFDDSDSDEEAPGWYLVDQLANEQPPLKKRKTGADGSPSSEKTSQPVANESRHRIIDTGGNSSSLWDLHPRSCLVPSPMFDNPVTHHESANVFTEHHVQSAPVEAPARVEAPPRSQEDFLKELRRKGHVPGSGSFCVPESDSDDSDDEESVPNKENQAGQEDQDNQENANTGLPWTQKPPPPPTPAHAQLPVQPEASPFVPGFQRERKTVDPVQAQRARAMKHTPAKPSRLREAMLPSPSLRSDAGASPLVATASPSLFVPASPVAILSDDDDMPDACALDFGDVELLHAATELLNKTTEDCYGGSEVLYKYDEDDETVSEEEDDEMN